jgi:hypothetical protein
MKSDLKTEKKRKIGEEELLTHEGKILRTPLLKKKTRQTRGNKITG